jgi:homoserine kinase
MPVTVHVPASTSNFGPGFDCLSAALNIWNRVTMDWGDATVPPPIVMEAAHLFWRETGTKEKPFQWAIEGDVPQSRGLGSSVTVRLGTLMGLNELNGNPLSKNEILKLCAQLEGHPDNAAAALYGGFTIVNESGNRVLRFDVLNSVHFVLYIPDIEVSTPAARSVLPGKYDRSAVTKNLANTAMIAAAFASHDYEALKGVLDDQLHQPYRRHLAPFMAPVIQAGIDAGALGGFLSGSGSTIACIVKGPSDAVADAMATAYPELTAKVKIVRVDNMGSKVLPSCAAG